MTGRNFAVTRTNSPFSAVKYTLQDAADGRVLRLYPTVYIHVSAASGNGKPITMTFGGLDLTSEVLS